MDPAPIVALVDDLMFLTRIREAAQRHGLAVRTVRRAEDVAAAATAARLVLVDLDSPRLPVADALEALAAAPGVTAARVGFYSHVETERARTAEAAGFQAIPRGAFVRQLDALVAAAVR
jgi:hypothetical protein